MVLTKADTAVAREWDNPRPLLKTFVLNQRALGLWWHVGDGGILRNSSSHGSCQTQLKQALSSEHPSDHLFQAAL